MATFITITTGLLTALSNVKQIAGYVDQLVTAVVLWYVNRQDAKTLASIADTAAQSARAQTDADRYAAAAAWQKALSSTRYSA